MRTGHLKSISAIFRGKYDESEGLPNLPYIRHAEGEKMYLPQGAVAEFFILHIYECELILIVTTELLNNTVICGHVFNPIIIFMAQIVVLPSLRNGNLALV